VERHRTHLLHLLVVVAFGCATASANLVQDADFSESSPPAFSSHWDVTSPAGVPGVAPSGSGTEFEALFEEGISDPYVVSLTQDGLGLVEGVTYEVSFDLSISVFEEFVGLPECDDFWVYLGQNPNPVYHWTDWLGDSDYAPEVLPQTITRFSTPGTLGTAADDLLEFRCEFDGNSESPPDVIRLTRITVDNVSVVPVPLPPGVVLAGLGMASCVAGAGMSRFRGRLRRRANLS
jgi:hypothetical protein